MLVVQYPLLSEPEVMNLRFATLVNLLPDYTFMRQQYDAGEVVSARGMRIVYFLDYRASADDSDDFTASGLLFCKLHAAGLVCEATMSKLLER